jgi:hypothetical protein
LQRTNSTTAGPDLHQCDTVHRILESTFEPCAPNFTLDLRPRKPLPARAHAHNLQACRRAQAGQSVKAGDSIALPSQPSTSDFHLVFVDPKGPGCRPVAVSGGNGALVQPLFQVCSHFSDRATRRDAHKALARWMQLTGRLHVQMHCPKEADRQTSLQALVLPPWLPSTQLRSIVPRAATANVAAPCPTQSPSAPPRPSSHLPHPAPSKPNTTNKKPIRPHPTQPAPPRAVPEGAQPCRATHGGSLLAGHRSAASPNPPLRRRPHRRLHRRRCAEPTPDARLSAPGLPGLALAQPRPNPNGPVRREAQAEAPTRTLTALSPAPPLSTSHLPPRQRPLPSPPPALARPAQFGCSSASPTHLPDVK